MLRPIALGKSMLYYFGCCLVLFLFLIISALYCYYMFKHLFQLLLLSVFQSSCFVIIISQHTKTLFFYQRCFVKYALPYYQVQNDNSMDGLQDIFWMKYNIYKVHLNKHNFLPPLKGLGIRTSFDVLIENCQKVILIQIFSKKFFFFQKQVPNFCFFFFFF